MKERSLLIGGVSIRLQEEIELTLGPKWYRDFTPIYFSDSGPFSELSNSKTPRAGRMGNTLCEVG